VRHAAEVHRQVRHHAQSFIKPGIKLVDMCEQIEELNRKLVKENGLEVSCLYCVVVPVVFCMLSSGRTFCVWLCRLASRSPRAARSTT
jgi:hypothetical protein